MTGEVTLQGRVLPIGGLKQKVLAAHRAGLTDVVMPFDNEPDLDDVPEAVRAAMHFHPVRNVREVLEIALDARPRRRDPHGVARIRTGRRVASAAVGELLAGKVAIVTGGGGGIGRGISRAVRAEGAAVVIAEIDADARARDAARDHRRRRARGDAWSPTCASRASPRRW